jgi:hypothetical protein
MEQKPIVKPLFPKGYQQKLFSSVNHEAVVNVIAYYKATVGELASVRGIEDVLSLYFAKDNANFDLSAWRKSLGRTDY